MRFEGHLRREGHGWTLSVKMGYKEVEGRLKNKEQRGGGERKG